MFQQIERLIGSSIRPIHVSLATLYVFVQTGIYRLPGSVNEWLHISTIGPFGDGHLSVLSRNQTTPTLARVLGITTPEGWRAMTLMIALVATALLFHMINKVAERTHTLGLLIAVVLFSPVVRVVFNGVADYDGMTLICLSVILLSNTPLPTLLAACVLGLTSPEQGAMALVSLALVMAVLDRSKIKLTICALATTITAGVSLRVVLRDEDIYWPEPSLYRNFGEFFAYLPHMYAGGIVVVLVVLHSIWIRRGLIPLAVILTSLFVLPGFALLITSDGARNFSPVLMVGSVFVVGNTTRNWSSRRSLITLAIAICVQVIYLFFGQSSFEPEFPTMFENLSSRPNPLP
jgi:hypothetical protein